MLVIGIDENGLGPLLGPLVVTAVSFEVDTYDAPVFWRQAGRDLFAADSKEVFSSSKLGSAEVATLAWLNEFGTLPTSYWALADATFVRPPLEMPCPIIPAYCTPSATQLPVWAKPKDLEWVLAQKVFTKDNPVQPGTVRLYAVCPGAFNTACALPDMNKFALDCHLMLKLFDSLASEYDGEVLGLLGKVGSTKKYGPWLQDANLGLWMTESETREQSTYRIAPNRTISFIRDGDQSHLPIAVASMIGKYARELAMRDINTLLRTEGTRAASGYHNRVTAAFVESTKKKRAEIGLEDCCFLRNS